MVPELLKLLVMHLALAWQRGNKEVVEASVAVLQRMAADLPSVASQLVGDSRCGALFADILKASAALTSHAIPFKVLS